MAEIKAGPDAPLTEWGIVELMFQWIDAQQFADQLKSQIERQIVMRQQTLKVGGVNCTYSGGTAPILREQTARAHADFTEELLEEFTTTTEQDPKIVTDWPGLLKKLGIKPADVDRGPRSSPTAKLSQVKK